jgi:hypothetical protein
MKTKNIAFTTVVLLLSCFALSSAVWAVDPPPDGGYANGNTAEGTDALKSLSPVGRHGAGAGNTALGFQTLFSLTTANHNTATGFNALRNNTAGNNTAVGANALYNNTTGSENTANGEGALFKNTRGFQNTAVGFQALFNNAGVDLQVPQTPVGYSNTAVGYQALFNLTLPEGCCESYYPNAGNVAVGSEALHRLILGSSNTAIGDRALVNIEIGDGNTAVGKAALANPNFTANNGRGNIALGEAAGIDFEFGANNIYIGNRGIRSESDTIRIGTQGEHINTYVAGIYGRPIGSVAVGVTTDGQLGTIGSSARFKQDIKPMDKASEVILSLKPVTFRYKPDIDPDHLPQFGLVAEDVAKVNPDLVARDDKGEIYTVRYDAVNAMLLNEFLKEHRKVQEQETKLAELNSRQTKQEKEFQSKLAEQNKRIEALTTGLQKVSAQVEANKPAPKLVLNTP